MVGRRAEVPQPVLPVRGLVQDRHQEALASPAHPGPHEEIALELADAVGGHREVAVAAREDDHAGHRRVGRAQEEERLGDARPRRDRANLLVGGPRGRGGERGGQEDGEKARAHG
jgi:hypothetical protein